VDGFYRPGFGGLCDGFGKNVVKVSREERAKFGFDIVHNRVVDGINELLFEFHTIVVLFLLVVLVLVFEN